MKNIAIITGASSGIGKAFVGEVLKSKEVFGIGEISEIWIVGRSESKLEAIKNEYKSCDKIITPIATDLLADNGTDMIISKLQEEAGELKVGLLVNSAGMGKRALFEEKDEKDWTDTIDLNCRALTLLTRRVLPFMIGDFKRKGGPRIINISSSASFLPQKTFACYAASKAYVTSFSVALNMELNLYGISSTAVTPGPVRTAFQERATDGASKDFSGFRKYIVADPEKLAAKALKAGIKGKSIYAYKVSQKAFYLISKLVPIGLMTIINRTRKDNK